MADDDSWNPENRLLGEVDRQQVALCSLEVLGDRGGVEIELARDLDVVSLRTGHGGVFRVSVGDELVFDKAEHGNQIDLDAIVEAVDSHVAADG